MAQDEKEIKKDIFSRFSVFFMCILVIIPLLENVQVIDNSRCSRLLSSVKNNHPRLFLPEQMKEVLCCKP